MFRMHSAGKIPAELLCFYAYLFENRVFFSEQTLVAHGIQPLIHP